MLLATTCSLLLLLWLVVLSAVVIVSTLLDDSEWPEACGSPGARACRALRAGAAGGGGGRGGGGGAAAPAVAPCSFSPASAASSWAPDASPAVAAACAAEQEAALAAGPDAPGGAGPDDRAFPRTIDLLFGPVGSSSTPLGDVARPLLLVQACATFDSLWARFPELGRPYSPADRILTVEAHPETAAHLTRRGRGDPRIDVRTAQAWDEDIPVVSLRWAPNGSPRVHTPVKVDLAARGAFVNYTDGGNAPAVRLDTVLPAPAGAGEGVVDALLIGDAAGDELRVLAGAARVLARTRFLFMPLRAGAMSADDWTRALGVIEGAGLAPAVLGNPRHVLLSAGVRPSPAALARIKRNVVLMAVRVADGAPAARAGHNAAFLRDLLLAGRRDITRASGPGANAAAAEARLEGSACAKWVEAQVTRACGGVIVGAPGGRAAA